MKPRSFSYVRAETVSEVCGLLAGQPDSAAVLAGGQSLIPLLNMRLATPSVVIDINDIAELDGIATEGEHLTIGALTRHATVLRSPLVHERAPILATALSHVAHPAIRNRGTFGGSIALADPAAELPACRVATEAEILLKSTSDTRNVPAGEFFLGAFTTARRPDEIVTGIRIPIAAGAQPFVFEEVARRRGDYALVGLAALARSDGAVPVASRFVFFGVGDRPLLALEVGALVASTEPAEIGREHLDAALDADLAHLDQDGQDAAFKRELALVLALRGGPAAWSKGTERLGVRDMSEEGFPLSTTVNGRAISRTVPARLSLADFLRDELGLTGTHLGCEHGVCGACTVVVDGSTARSCLLLAVQAHGHVIETIEGATASERLAELQEAFVQRHALQCGFCTPGVLLTAAELIGRGARLTRDEIRQYISGNYCRCTGYQAIVDAIEAASRSGSPHPVESRGT